MIAFPTLLGKYPQGTFPPLTQRENSSEGLKQGRIDPHNSRLGNDKYTVNAITGLHFKPRLQGYVSYSLRYSSCHIGIVLVPSIIYVTYRVSTELSAWQV